MPPGQKANSDNLGQSFCFLYNNGIVCTHLNRLNQVILMSTHIQFHDKIRKIPLILVSLSYQKNFVGTQTSVRIFHGKRSMGVRVIE